MKHRLVDTTWANCVRNPGPRLALATLLCPSLAIAETSPSAAPADRCNEALTQHIRAHVFLIEAKDCQGTGPRKSTGFRDQDGQIITALHGVVGCTRIRAVSADGRPYEDLKVTQYDADADAARLALDTNEPGFTLTPSPHGQAQDTLGAHCAFGFEHGQLDKFIYRCSPPQWPNNTVEAMFRDSSDLEPLDKRKSPHLDRLSFMLTIAGNNGVSGAPVLNYDVAACTSDSAPSKPPEVIGYVFGYRERQQTFALYVNDLHWTNRDSPRLTYASLENAEIPSVLLSTLETPYDYRWVAWTGIGAGSALLAASVWQWIVFANENAEAGDLCQTRRGGLAGCADAEDRNQYLSARDDAKHARTLAAIFGGLGAATLVTSIVLFPEADSGTAQPSVAFSADPFAGDARASLSWAW